MILLLTSLLCCSVASRFCRYASHIVGIEWELRGMEHWNNDECYIVISNHQSSLDILGTSILIFSNKFNYGYFSPDDIFYA